MAGYKLEAEVPEGYSLSARNVAVFVPREEALAYCTFSDGQRLRVINDGPVRLKGNIYAPLGSNGVNDGYSGREISKAELDYLNLRHFVFRAYEILEEIS